MITEFIQYVQKHKILIPLILLGWIVSYSILSPFSQDLGHDVYWHISLISVAFRSFPFQVPVFSGATLQGYNYLLDLILYILTYSGASAYVVYTLIAPLSYLSLVTILGVVFAKRFSHSFSFVVSFLFFLFFATPFTYVLSFIRTGSFLRGFEFPTTMQSATALGNISYAMTVPLFLAVSIILLNKKLTIRNAILLSILIAIAFGIKFYGGISLGILVGSQFLTSFLIDRSISRFLLRTSILFLASLLSVLLFYNPFSSHATGSIFGFSPLATVHPLIEDPNGIYIRYFVDARYTLLESPSFSPRLLLIELITIGLYVFYNFGTRVIGFGSIIFRGINRSMSQLEISLFITAIVTAFFSMFFVQKGGDWWNTVQFFGYTSLFFNIFSAFSLSRLIARKNRFGILFVIFIIILSAPLNIELVKRGFVDDFGKASTISSTELEAIKFLKNQPFGVVFAFPVAYTSSQLSALSEKPLYYADEGVLSNMGIDYTSRKEQLSHLELLNIESLPVSYIYIKTENMPHIFAESGKIIKQLQNSEFFENIYSNDEIYIFSKKHNYDEKK